MFDFYQKYMFYILFLNYFTFYFFLKHIITNIDLNKNIKIMKNLKLNVQELSIEDQKNIDGGLFL